MGARSGRRDGGQALPLLCAVLALAVAGLVGLAAMGRAAVDRAVARTAADAAALAGAAGGWEQAAAMARANGADLVEFRAEGADTVVVVRVGEATARARARRDRVDTTAAAAGASAGGGDRRGLRASLLTALDRADALLGRPVPVVSGLRTRAQQEALWRRRQTNPFPVAPPGSSRHETGRAVDVPHAFVDDLLSVAARAGLCQPLPMADPVHFEQCPPTG